MPSDNSGNSDKNFQIGVISGWNQITTQYPAGTHAPAEHDFTLADLLALLRELKKYLDPDRLHELEKMITDHLNDFNNPHKVTLETMGTSVLKELYKLWIAEGNTGSEDQFLKVIFQYVRIADLPTTYEGKARDQVPSVFGLAKYVDRHDKDPNAHEALFKKLMPGGPIYMEPSFAAYGYCGFPEFVNISRDSEMYYIDATGNLSIAPKNHIPCDFTYGIGAFPIFDEITGFIANNADMGNLISEYTLNNLSITYHETTDHEFDLPFSSKYGRLKESVDSNPLEHSLEYTKSGTDYTAGKIYTVSFFVRHLRTDTINKLIGLYLPGVFPDPYSFIHFNLEEQTFFKNSSVADNVLIGGVSKLHNGWYRVWATFHITTTTPMKFKINTLDIVDGDFTYKADGAFVMDVLYPQITETSQITPPLISDSVNLPVLAPTYLEIDTTQIYLNKYNGLEGTFVFTVASHLGDNLSTAKFLYDVSTDDDISILSGKFPTNHKKRLYCTYNQDTGVNIGYKYLNANTKTIFTTYAHSYSPNKQVFASSVQLPEAIEHTSKTLGQLSKKIYIGCDKYKTSTSVLNSYISGFAYYPFACTEDQVLSLIGE